MFRNTLLTMLLAALASSSFAEDAFTGVYRCAGDLSFTVRVEGEVAWVMWPADAVRLVRDPDGGDRYIAGEWSLRLGGERIELNGPEGRFEGCTNDPYQARWAAARLDGVDFRAVGPGSDPWTLELRTRRSATLVRGGERLRLPLSHPLIDDGGNTVYRMEAGDRRMTLIIRKQPCEIPRIGAGRQVALLVDDEHLTGCGLSLE
ncbi:MAG TPA: hypothetical protein ENK54_01470 [Thiotrichales bacterium]|nr:hypothetical protein [Thiotrichales bacterium]